MKTRHIDLAPGIASEDSDLTADANRYLIALREREAPPGFPALPTAPMLGIDRIIAMNDQGGRFGRGVVEAEVATDRFGWAFDCHFENDPVLPGSLILDSLWQLAGFYGGCVGLNGRGRALRVGDVRFIREVKPAHRRLRYALQIRRIGVGRQVISADGEAYVDGQLCASASGLLVQISREDSRDLPREEAA
jgi:3-hydroxyacyl-[acyl-carrier protein] dehydratase/trans-2-decenoyl-[acyl-carrier protein] isomerase